MQLMKASSQLTPPNLQFVLFQLLGKLCGFCISNVPPFRLDFTYLNILHSLVEAVGSSGVDGTGLHKHSLQVVQQG